MFQARGMLSQRWPENQDSSSSPSYREDRLRKTRGYSQPWGTVGGASDRTNHSTDEGGQPQVSRKGRPRDLLERRGEQEHESAERRHGQDLVPFQK